MCSRDDWVFDRGLEKKGWTTRSSTVVERLKDFPLLSLEYVVLNYCAKYYEDG